MPKLRQIQGHCPGRQVEKNQKGDRMKLKNLFGKKKQKSDETNAEEQSEEQKTEEKKLKEKEIKDKKPPLRGWLYRKFTKQDEKPKTRAGQLLRGGFLSLISF